MKKNFVYIMCLMLVALLQACTNEVDDLFDTPTQERINQSTKECRDLLISAEYGWKIDYYPSNTQKYGGFAMTVKFDENTVTAASEITDDPTEEYTSTYSMDTDRGTTLNFDTYNPVLHYFADPDINQGGGLGKGYEGDYEFIIQEKKADEIILRGKKTRNLMRMTKLTAPSSEYLGDVIASRDKILEGMTGLLGFSGNVNGAETSFSLVSSRIMSIQCGDNLTVVPYMFTENGISFYRPVMINGKEVTSLEWGDELKSFKANDNALQRVEDPVYTKFTRFLGDYNMQYFYGPNERNVDITLSTYEYSSSSKTYVVEGLPFPLLVFYNVAKDCMELLTYNTGECNVAMWEVIGDGNLNWGSGLGMIGVLREGTDNVYEFVDNGAWGSYTARALILWGSGGEYKGYGGDTSFQYIVFTKK